MYFALAEQVAMLKIGTTIDLEGRTKELDAGSPVPLTLLGSIRGGLAVENWCHRMCSDSHAHHEWFHWTEGAQAFVREVLGHGNDAALLLCPDKAERDRLDGPSFFIGPRHRPPRPAAPGSVTS